MSYTLETWQSALWTDTFSLYAPIVGGISSTGQGDDISWSGTPTYTNVPGLFHATDNAFSPDLEGRQLRADLYITQDKFSFHVDQTIEDGYLIQLTTSGHPENGTYWIVLSDKKNRNLLKKAQIRGKRTPPPDFV